MSLIATSLDFNSFPQFMLRILAPQFMQNSSHRARLQNLMERRLKQYSSQYEETQVSKEFKSGITST